MAIFVSPTIIGFFLFINSVFKNPISRFFISKGKKMFEELVQDG